METRTSNERSTYKNIIWVSTDKTQDGKYPSRVNLVLDSRGNKKGHHSLTRSKQLFRENTGALTYGEDNLSDRQRRKS